MKKPLLFSILLLAANPLLAQRFDPNTKPPTTPPPTTKPPQPSLDPALNGNLTNEPPAPKVVKYPVTVALTLGTQGLGLEGRVGVLPQLNARLGFSYLAASLVANAKLENLDVKMSSDPKFTNIHLLAEYQPFKKADWFRLVGGLGYFMTATTPIDIYPENSRKYGDIVISPSMMGGMKGEVNWGGIAPYLGLGLLRAFPHDRFSVNLDAGTYMLSKPTVTLDGYGAMSDNSQNAAIVEENMASYRWLPVLQFNFTYKIR